MSAVRAPDTIEPFFGYRGWTMSKGRLNALVQGVIWHKGPNRAECMIGEGHGAQMTRLHMALGWQPGMDEIAKLAWEQHVKEQGGDAAFDNRVPAEWCVCGFYAMKDPALVSTRAALSPYHGVTGRIRMWGKVIEGEDGYRAEWAQIDCLFLPRDWLLRLRVRKMAKRYEVAVEEAPPSLRGQGVYPTVLPVVLGYEVVYWTLRGTGLNDIAAWMTLGYLTVMTWFIAKNFKTMVSTFRELIRLRKAKSG